MSVALVHDYLTQRGGAERVVLTMLRAFPEAPVYTSFYDPDRTFPEFRAADIRTFRLNHIRPFRANHRLALPLLAHSFSRLEISTDIVLCSSSGWAHGVRTTGRKLVYCYAPARWLYQASTYTGHRRQVAKTALTLLRQYLVRWDRRAAATASRYLTSSTAVRDRIRRAYGIEADILPPPPAVGPDGAHTQITGVDPGFVLCVARLLPYKNVEAIVEGFRSMPEERLVVVGEGPEEGRLRQSADPNVNFVGTVSDEGLRWLYANCRGVVAASYEDYGLTPLEAAAFGKPAAVLRWGGFRDTVAEGRTGLFFDHPTPTAIRGAMVRLLGTTWEPEPIRRHAAAYSQERFIHGLRQIVESESNRS